VLLTVNVKVIENGQYRYGIRSRDNCAKIKQIQKCKLGVGCRCAEKLNKAIQDPTNCKGGNRGSQKCQSKDGSQVSEKIFLRTRT